MAPVETWVARGGFMNVNVSRFMDRKKAAFTVEVLTPMFLGGADGPGSLPGNGTGSLVESFELVFSTTVA